MGDGVTTYNEIDPYAAEWLRNLIVAGHIPAGSVDERSITEIKASELPQTAHLFAGIGGWPLALKLAGWPDDRPVWTGSCPCQPFSSAGKSGGVGDERHLWPAFRRLIAECHPPVIFGEQVASKDGRAWLAGVRVDLERMGYAVGCADLPAAGVGAPHRRGRLFWVADSKGERHRTEPNGRSDSESEATRGIVVAGRHGDECSSAIRGGESVHHQNGGLETGSRQESIATDGLGDTNECGRAGERRNRKERIAKSGAWDDFDIVMCRDPRGGPDIARRVESGTFPLAHGIPDRVGKLRAYGNAIVPQVAAEFIAAYIDVAF